MFTEKKRRMFGIHLTRGTAGGFKNHCEERDQWFGKVKRKVMINWVRVMRRPVWVSKDSKWQQRIF